MELSRMTESLEVLKNDLFANLKNLLIDFIADNHFHDDLEDPESTFIDNWKHDFDYMAETYPNILPRPEDKTFEFAKRAVMEWANNL
jgi:hypothetical protein